MAAMAGWYRARQASANVPGSMSEIALMSRNARASRATPVRQSTTVPKVSNRTARIGCPVDAQM